MPFNIQTFRAEMVKDGARPNLFDISMVIPNLADPNGAASTKLTFMARAAQLPGSTVNSIPVMYFGRELKFAGNRNFADWSVTIINDEDFMVRDAMERWMNGINQHVENRRNSLFTSPRDYQTNATVRQYEKVGINNKSYTFIGMFPTDITPIDVDWASNDTIEEYSVTFAYQWWESNTTTVSEENNIGIN